MGNLLKEALKNLCGSNQWSYAVLWKISCQSPNLLIWEECFYEPVSQSHLLGISRTEDPGIGFEGYNSRGFSTGFQAGDNLHLLINKMMAENHVNIVGEGSVGRAALTGNHQWILSEDYKRETQPPEVFQELYQQFRAGIQTVAIIPVLPHGAVQFGSFFAMAENVSFVNDVKTSVLQLHQDPSILLSDSSTPFIHESCNYVQNSSVSSGIFTSVPITNSQLISSSHDNVNNFTANHAIDYSSCSRHYFTDERNVKHESIACNERMENNAIQSHGIPLSKHDESKNSGKLLPDFALAKRKHEYEARSSSIKNAEYEDAYMETQSGDDLFDILGIDFKNKLYTGNMDDNNSPSVQSLVNTSEIYSLGHGSDYLLDAVVSDVPSSAKQLLDDNVSRGTTLKNNVELPYSQVQVVDQIKEELPCVSEYLAKAEAMSSCSFLSESSMDFSGTYSPSSSIFGSQISSSTSKGYDMKPSSSASTGYSKKPDEKKSKTSRKNPKPGESPRPRPKDRQMIQDRVKELREIVPNGAKCSIDSLLERTIKHMLFLQSITKHADKLKLIGESKIINKDGSLLSKDKFGGGATWAYEVGSESMICPIIVEDLNQPRQMLVEMLCETRGLFLEIADIIRGMGLTILKGVMETQNDKIWAHFAVEANRDVTRMEVFVSLVHLLEQNAKTGIQPVEDINKDIP